MLSSRGVIQLLAQCLESQERVALATVVEVRGAAPAQVGFKLLARTDGTSHGNVGGGRLEQCVRQECVEALREGRSRLTHHALCEEGPDAVGMLCGGDVTVFVEVYQTAPVLLIVGGGHIGAALAELARIVGFDVRVADVRPDRATVSQFDPATITPSTHVVLITEDHVTDERALRQVLGTPAGYVGMIGSQRKVAAILGHLKADGFSDQKLAAIHAPIGLDLGGRTPAEIALSILAEVVQVRYRRSGNPLRGDPARA